MGILLKIAVERTDPSRGWTFGGSVGMGPSTSVFPVVEESGAGSPRACSKGGCKGCKKRRSPGERVDVAIKSFYLSTFLLSTGGVLDGPRCRPAFVRSTSFPTAFSS